MKIIFPVAADQGLESRLCDHFGSAPLFLLVDDQARTMVSIVNRDREHQAGSCRPIMAPGWQAVDGVVVSGIGTGALTGLKQAGFKVYRAGAETVAANLALLKHQGLPEVGPQPHSAEETDDDPQFGCGF